MATENENASDVDESGTVSSTVSSVIPHVPDSSTAVLNNFAAEISSATRVCTECKTIIAENKVQIKHTERDDIDVTLDMGGFDYWYHVECFVRNARKVEWFDQSADKLPGFNSLPESAKNAVRLQFGETATVETGKFSAHTHTNTFE